MHEPQKRLSISRKNTEYEPFFKQKFSGESGKTSDSGAFFSKSPAIQRFPLEIANKDKPLSIPNEDSFYQLIGSEAVLTSLQVHQLKKAITFSNTIKEEDKPRLLDYLQSQRSAEFKQPFAPSEYYKDAQGQGMDPFTEETLVKDQHRGQTNAEIEWRDEFTSLTIRVVEKFGEGEWKMAELLRGMTHRHADTVKEIEVVGIVNDDHREKWAEWEKQANDNGTHFTAMYEELSAHKPEAEANEMVERAYRTKRDSHFQTTPLIKMVRALIKLLGREEEKNEINEKSLLFTLKDIRE